jgi:hypothetical protein
VRCATKEGAVETLYRFETLLTRSSTGLFEDNANRMASDRLLPTPNVIADLDLELFFLGVEEGLIHLERGGRFNTRDQYLSQLAAYVELVSALGYPFGRVFFELPEKALQLDVAVVGDGGDVVVLGEAKRESSMLDRLATGVVERFASAAPIDDSKKRGDEVRQLAWRLWTTHAPYLWLVGPGSRQAYACSYEPLRLERLAALPNARDLGLHGMCPEPLEVPDLKGGSKK